MSAPTPRQIEVWADWVGLPATTLMGHLFAIPSKGKEVFSFEYDQKWLQEEGGRAQVLDPALGLYRGHQYAPGGKENFGIFLDSAPDRWGRMLMRRREAQQARAEDRPERRILESDYLLGVFDLHRQGALRFRTEPGGPWRDADPALAAPPRTSLRELEHASLELEKDNAEKKPHYARWLKMLMAPGASLGGGRPKASILDPKGQLWIAKFPSRHDDQDMGAWEYVVHRLAERAGVSVAPAMARKFASRHHTFLTRRFDRSIQGGRIHFASAMTLLQRSDGDDAETGASYLELAALLTQQGSSPTVDLEQLWRRIVFFICVSNTDDHLQNHGFLLCPDGWKLAPAYDINPTETGDGLKLNISETDNSQNLALAREVAPFFRVKPRQGETIIKQVIAAAKAWRAEANKLQLSKSGQDRMANAFRVAEAA